MSEIKEGDILDYAYQVLLAEGKELHFKEIYRRATELGWRSDNQAPERQMYRAMRMDIRNNGEHSRFRQPQDAHLTLRRFHEAYTPLSPVKTAAERRQHYVEKKQQEATCPVRCGYCTFISFDGIMEVTQEYGTCSEYKRSDRLSVRFDTPGCPLWAQRTPTQRNNDYKMRTELMKAVVKLNAEVDAVHRTRVRALNATKQRDAGVKTSTGATIPGFEGMVKPPWEM